MNSQKLDRREFLLSASLLPAGALGSGQGEQDFSKVQIKVDECQIRRRNHEGRTLHCAICKTQPG